MKRSVLLIFIFSAVLCSAQNRHRCDSLKRTLTKEQDDSLLMHTYSELALEYANDSVNAFSFAGKVKSIANKNKNARWQCDADMLFARVCAILKDRERSEKYLLEGLALATNSNYARGVGLYHTLSGLMMTDKHSDDQHPLIEEHFKNGIATAKKTGNKNDLAWAYFYRSAYYYRDSEHDAGLQDALEALRDCDRSDVLLYSKTLNLVRLTYVSMGNREKSFEFALKYLNDRESQKDTSQLGYANTYVANGLSFIRNYANAKSYFDKAIFYGLKENDPVLLSTAYERYAVMLTNQEKYAESIIYHRKALEYQYKTGQTRSIPLILGNLGEAYLDLHNFDSAISCQQRALTLRLQYHITEGIMFSYMSFGEIYNAKKDHRTATEYGKKALKISSERGFHNYDINIYQVLYDAAKGSGDFKSALDYIEKLKSINDSVNDLSNSSKIDQMKANYESDKQDRERELAGKLKDEEQKAETTRQENFRNFIIAILAFVSIFLVAVLRNYRQKKKANIVLAEQKDMIEKQKDEMERQKDMVEDKNKEILDSIHYAKRIQSSLLPTDKYIRKSIDRLKKDTK